MRLFVPALSFVLTLLYFSSSLAHAHNHAHHDSKHLHEPSVEALADHLAHTIDEGARLGAPTYDLESEALGNQLLETAHNAVFADLEKQGPPSKLRLAGEALRDVVSGVNPLKLGRWLIETGRKHGPAIAIAIGTTELIEQVGMLYAAKHPTLLFLVPLYLTHAADVAVLTLALGLPKFASIAGRWRRHGGPGGYYRHLLAQRRILPLDWSELISAPRWRTDASEVRFAVVAEGWLERKLPRLVRIAFSPRKLALRESVPTFGVWELERIARQGGVEPALFRELKSEPRVYTAVLLREIARTESAAQLFRMHLEARDHTAPVLRSLDAARLAEAGDIAVLERLGETPDLVAERLLWFFKSRRDALFESLPEQPRAIRSSQRKLFRRLARLLDADRGLARTAATAYVAAESADWESLYESLSETRGVLGLIEIERENARSGKDDDHRGLHRCQELLSRG